MSRPSKNESRIYFKKKFYKQTSGYWVSREWDKIHKVYNTLLAHRWVWENINGPIPTNMEIHHKDKDKSNNDISNLELVSRSEHQAIHAKESSQIDHLNKVRPIEWLKSEEGRKAVSEKGKEVWSNRELHEIICESCGKSAFFKRWARFCSKNCYMKWCYANKINFIDATCPICNMVFKKPKGKKTIYCSLKCKNKRVELKKS